MSDAGAGEKLKIFISYSRRDSAAFADELVAGLEFGGFAPFLDRHDIAAGEDWEGRLGGLIAQSDTVVFVISPEAVKSKQCRWEVDRATAATSCACERKIAWLPGSSMTCDWARFAMNRSRSGLIIRSCLGITA